MIAIQRLITLLLMTLIAEPAVAQTHCSLTIELLGIESHEGEIDLALYDTEQGFPTDFSAAVQRVTKSIAPDRSFTHVFSALPCGIEYAVAAHHDVNGNKKVDTKWIVLPSEPLGVSNNPAGRMGPPLYKDAAFILSHDMALRIVMKRI